MSTKSTFTMICDVCEKEFPRTMNNRKDFLSVTIYTSEATGWSRDVCPDCGKPVLAVVWPNGVADVKR